MKYGRLNYANLFRLRLRISIDGERIKTRTQNKLNPSKRCCVTAIRVAKKRKTHKKHRNRHGRHNKRTYMGMKANAWLEIIMNQTEMM